MTRVGVLMWDWKGSLDINPLGQILHDLTADLNGRRLTVQEVDTGSDDYGIVIGPEPLDGATAARAFRQWFDSEGRSNVIEMEGPS